MHAAHALDISDRSRRAARRCAAKRAACQSRAARAPAAAAPRAADGATFRATDTLFALDGALLHSDERRCLTWHKKWTIPKVHVRVEAIDTMLGAPPQLLHALICAGTLRAESDLLHEEGLGGTCLRRVVGGSLAWFRCAAVGVASAAGSDSERSRFIFEQCMATDARAKCGKPGRDLLPQRL